MLERLNSCAGPSPARVYALEAENRKRTDEVRELQKVGAATRGSAHSFSHALNLCATPQTAAPQAPAHTPLAARAKCSSPALQALSDAHTYLFEERERLLALQAECDGLRLQEVEDRARIKQLLSLSQPVEHKVVYGGRENGPGPQSSVVLPRMACSSSGGSRGRSPRRGAAVTSAQQQLQQQQGPQPRSILRTVYLPTAQSEALALKCEALAAQLAEQKKFAAERIAALTEDRAIRERDAATAAAALSRTAEELAERLRGAEEALRCTTRDFILARQQRDAAEAAAAEAHAAAVQEREAGAAALEAAGLRAAAQLAALRQELEADAQQATQVGILLISSCLAHFCAARGRLSSVFPPISMRVVSFVKRVGS